MTATPRSWARLGFAAVLIVWGLATLRSCACTMESIGWLHDVHLPIHETGHLVFGPFGEIPQLLGGSVFQVLVPLAFVTRFALRREWYAAAVCLWWTAHSLWDVSVYVADAKLRELPLLGDDPDNHDWWNLLALWERLDQAALYGQRVRGTGTLLYLAAAVGMLADRHGRPAAAADVHAVLPTPQ